MYICGMHVYYVYSHPVEGSTPQEYIFRTCGSFLSPSRAQYYDWDNNLCHRFDWMDENQLSQVESDVEIPDTINASKAEYFVGFEPEKLAKEVCMHRV